MQDFKRVCREYQSKQFWPINSSPEKKPFRYKNELRKRKNRKVNHSFLKQQKMFKMEYCVSVLHESTRPITFASNFSVWIGVSQPRLKKWLLRSSAVAQHSGIFRRVRIFMNYCTTSSIEQHFEHVWYDLTFYNR